ncbi:MAG: hypothetical protein IPM31_15810 [Anaerolineae bacterium]|nr:hypothetical protein [Anaerolineae bacterium]MBL8105872.1 hypothetical protein [Anaerolineales bacterium]MCC7188523.1 hypothetical protein [Anaerolineales bacterium]
MEINWSIAGWIIAVLVFYTIGFYEGRSTGYKKRQREEEQESAKTQPTPVAVEDNPAVLKPKKENENFTREFDSPPALTPEYDQRLNYAATPPAPQPPLSQPLPASTNPASTPLSPVSFKPAAKSAEPAAEKKPAPPPTSIVGQINLVLQEKLAGSALADRDISMSQSAEGGVIVTVGASQYTGVDEVPDAEVKAVIRAAIAEWEKKYTPGLR